MEYSSDTQTTITKYFEINCWSGPAKMTITDLCNEIFYKTLFVSKSSTAIETTMTVELSESQAG